MDHTIFIGDSHLQESYLQIMKILDAAYWVGARGRINEPINIISSNCSGI